MVRRTHPQIELRHLNPLQRIRPNDHVSRGTEAVTFRIPEGAAGTMVSLSDGIGRLTPT